MSEPGAIDLAFMGTGNAFAPQRCWSGFVLNQRHLFDAPPTALYSLKRMGVPLAGIQSVFVSHFHADHFFGLPFLLLEYAYLTKRSEDLTIIGPPGIEPRLRQLVEIGYPSLNDGDHGYRLCYVEIEDGAASEVNGLRYETVEVEHGGEALRAFGFRVQAEGRTLAYTGDTSYCEQLVPLARGADVLVTDCTYAAGRNNPEHMSFEEVRELQARIGGATEILLTHLGEPPPGKGCRRITVAADQTRYRF
ncbi:MAG TPA: MBL fold metallo-hydrolase [Dehalococcoidia bacterium]|nr:MBL fold metallo-hydrolase [Dehalococcoidia bacterium]